MSKKLGNNNDPDLLFVENNFGHQQLVYWFGHSRAPIGLATLLMYGLDFPKQLDIVLRLFPRSTLQPGVIATSAHTENPT